LQECPAHETILVVICSKEAPDLTDNRPRLLLADREDLREAFVIGCLAMVRRGDRLPDQIMHIIAREVGLYLEGEAEDLSTFGLE
jgi:hypothetical protein